MKPEPKGSKEMSNALLRPGRRAKLGAVLGVYLRPRLLIILLLGFSAGLPLALSSSTLAIWMVERGVDLGTIGLYALIGLPYSIKFLWAPIVDALRIPFLTQWLGRRRAWLIFSQFLLMTAIIFLGGLDPLKTPYLVALGALIVATASATQDIVIDAFRIESLEVDEQAAGMAYYVSAYRIAMLVSTAGVITLVAMLENWGLSQAQTWFYGYVASALLILVGVAAVLHAREPEPLKENNSDVPELAEIMDTSPFRRLVDTTKEAFSEFLSKPNIALILLFVVLFKFCDALAGIMTGPFVLDIGFDKTTYAAVVKGVGLIAVLLGGLVGGLMARTPNIGNALLLGGILQMLSNLVFSLQALIGAQTWALVATIIIENFTGGLGTVIFVAYLSLLCGNTRNTATQYALLTALAAVGRTLLSSSAGFLAADLGWPLFFAATAIAAIPGLALLVHLQRQGHFEELALLNLTHKNFK